MVTTQILILALASISVASPLATTPSVDTHSLFARTSCSTTGSASCTNTTVQSNLCCFEYPGGQLLQTQFWDFNPSTGPSDSWTIHGLWPDHCDGTYDSNCDSSRAYTDISTILSNGGASDVLSYMKSYWLDINGNHESFWAHEWGKHGTCMSTLKPACISSSVRGQDAIYYFTRVVNLFKTLPTYDFLGAAGIYPSSTVTYTLAQISAAVKAKWGYTPAFDCTSGSLNAISYYYHLKGSVIDGTLVPIDAPKAGTCGSTGIKYPLKSGSTPTTTATAPAGTSTAIPTKATIVGITSSGTQTGCLLTAGTWSVQTCATYTITTVSGGFTLKTSKGLCEVNGGILSCSSSVSSGTVFTSSGGLLAYSGSTAFTGDSVPSGTAQVSVYTGSSRAQDITLRVVSA
ncbi:ribonuclease T2 family, putative [Rhizoctonia solani AG-1 IB]|uniref:Ribonuclease T2-like n=1 Tax=Thanatephorus cucumeris (strain AG1-IB / isolate 7/3/14) TaxID=1108050 RepID=A0A0B7FK01_THACB|nr:ribonuclease T2 family, putative [Rhizoctonia solani AG-1 IB]